MPQHLKESISEKNLAGFEKRVKRIAPTMSFEDAWSRYHLNQFFTNTRETREEIEEMFIKAKNASSLLKNLSKLEDPGKFLVPCSIYGVEFTDSLCHTGSAVSLMSKDIAESRPSDRATKVHSEFADSSTKSPLVPLRIYLSK